MDLIILSSYFVKQGILLGVTETVIFWVYVPSLVRYVFLTTTGKSLSPTIN